MAEFFKCAYRVEHFLLRISPTCIPCPNKIFRLEIALKFKLPKNYQIFLFRRVIARKKTCILPKKFSPALNLPMASSPTLFDPLNELNVFLDSLLQYNILNRSPFLLFRSY